MLIPVSILTFPSCSHALIAGQDMEWGCRALLFRTWVTQTLTNALLHCAMCCTGQAQGSLSAYSQFYQPSLTDVFLSSSKKKNLILYSR